MAVTLEDLQIRFTAEMGGLNSQLNGIKQQLGGVEGASQKTASKLGMMAKAGIAFAGVMVGRALVNVGQEAIQMANDVTESESLFQVSMGDMADSTREWSKELQSSLGISEYSARKNVGVLNTMFKSMGLGKEPAAEMSKNMVELANDMASFYNLPVDEAFAKLRSGITGEQEPLKQLGILVDEATVKTYALRTGMIKEGQTMTAQQKVAARYGAIIEQTGDAQGDLARTMDSPTNQLRRMSVEMDNAKIALGQALQPALLAVLPVLTNMARGAGSVIQALSGMGGQGVSAFDDLTISLDEAREDIKDVIDHSQTDIVDNLKDLSKKTDSALADYATAEKKTKKVAIELSFGEPTTTGEDRVKTGIDTIAQAVLGYSSVIRKTMTAVLDSKLEGGEITQEQYNTKIRALNKSMDGLDKTAEKFETQAEALVNVALADGEVTEKEAGKVGAKVVAFATSTVALINKDKIKQLKAVDVAIKDGDITEAEGADWKGAIEAAAQTAIGVVTAQVTVVKAELGTLNWTEKTFTPEETAAIVGVIETGIGTVTIAVDAIIDQVNTTFTNTGAIGLAVEQLYLGLSEKVADNNKELGEILNAWVEEGAPTKETWSRALEIREENARLVAIMSGGLTGEGMVNEALFNLEFNSESIKNYFKALDEALKTETASAETIFTEQKNILLNAFGQPEFGSILEAFDLAGLTYEQAVAALEQRMIASIQAVESGAAIEAAKRLGPSIASAISSDDVKISIKATYDALEFIESLDLENLSTEAKQAVLDMLTGLEIPTTDQFIGIFGGGNPFQEAIDALTEGLKTDEVEGAATDVTEAATPDPPVVDGVGTGVTDEISTELTEGQTAVKTAADGVAAAATPIIPDTVSLGESIPNGLITGMDNKLDDVKKKATELASAAITAIKLALLVGSPSKITTEIGGFFGKGFANGIINSANLASRAAAGLANGAINALNSPSISTMTPPQSVSTQPQSAQGTNNATFELVIDGEKLGKVAIKNINDIQRRTGRAILNLGG